MLLPFDGDPDGHLKHGLRNSPTQEEYILGIVLDPQDLSRPAYDGSLTKEEGMPTIEAIAGNRLC